MLKNYVKIALRNILKNKLYSFIAVFGLAFGMACFLIIFSYIRFEKSYDDFHTNKKNIYRVDKQIKSGGRTFYRSLIGASTAPLLKEEFSPIKNTVRFTNLFNCFVNTEKSTYREKRFLFADSSVLSVFSFPLKAGNPQTALANPFTVIITPQTAEKYFGNKNPIGQEIFLQTKEHPEKFSFIVTGITNIIPVNSTIKFDFLASFSSLRTIMGNQFMDNNWEGPVWTYVQLQDNYNSQRLEPLFSSFAKNYIPREEYNAVDFRLVSLEDTYYERGDGLQIGDWGIKPFSYLLLFMTVLVLIIACINYMNLLSAHSITRAKEIGVRKVQGANRVQLVTQFIGESVIISIISFVVALVLVELLLPSFKLLLSNTWSSFGFVAKRQVDYDIFYPDVLFYMVIITIVIGIMSGLYPAIVLSRYNTSHILKGELSSGRSSNFVRKVFVVTQFTISIVFIISSLHVLWQIHKWKNTNLGFNDKGLICLPVYDNSVRNKYEMFKSSLLESADINGVTSSNLIPGGLDANKLYLKSDDTKDINAVIYFVDKDFIKTIGLNIEKGRDFSETNLSDSKYSLIANQAAVKACGWNNISEQQVQLYTKENDVENIRYTCNVIGEIKNFNYRFFKSADDPLVLIIEPRTINHILIRVNEFNVQGSLEYIKSTWNTMGFRQSFEYTYLSDELKASYSIYEAMDSFIRFAAMITIIIAVLGLFALSSFIIDRKTKEIGIRKVMGASVSNIIYNLSNSFILLVVIAIAIAVPIAYKIVPMFLQQLPNHININIWFMMIAALCVIVFSLIVVGVKALKAAAVNPVQSLKYE